MFFAGTAKLGPWFAHLITFMVPTCALFRVWPQGLRFLFRDYWRGDLRPSNVTHVLAFLGKVNELAVPFAVALTGFWPGVIL